MSDDMNKIREYHRLNSIKPADEKLIPIVNQITELIFDTIFSPDAKEAYFVKSYNCPEVTVYDRQGNPTTSVPEYCLKLRDITIGAGNNKKNTEPILVFL